ncbi:putative metal-dependent hydrolase [Lactococcus phage PMBT68]|nr:putative metal-dependent hydrolase [Lactococcus phage P1411]
MKFIEYIGGTSGSSGNCHLLTLERMGTVIVLDCGVPFKFVKSLMDEVPFKVEQVILAVTHQHTDHYNKATIKHIMKDYNTVLTGYDGLSKDSQPIVLIKKNGIKLFVVRQRFNHGEVDSYGFVIKAMDIDSKELDKVGYITDIDMSNAQYFESKVCLFHDCDLLLLEANYAEQFYTDCFMNPDKYEQFGYDILGGFNRHLTREYSEQLAKNLNAKVYEPIHKSSRFYEWGD